MDEKDMGVGIAGTIKEMTDRANAMAAETRLQFDTLLTMQKDERMEMQKMYQEERAHDRKFFGRIIIGLVLTLAILLGGIIGAVTYILTNYEIVVGAYQDVYVGGDGESTINDGIHYNKD